MSTKNLWQFRSVQQTGQNTRLSYDLGSNCSISLRSEPYSENVNISDGFGNFITPSESDVVVTFGLPSNINNFDLNGDVRILCSTTGFLRDADLFNNTKVPFTDFSFSLDINDRDNPKYRCIIPSVEGTIIYISLFYFNEQSNVWLTSPNYLIDRIVTRGQLGDWGEKMFNLLPRYARKIDGDNGDSVKKLTKVLGSTLDDFDSVLKSVKDVDPYTIDAGRIPFLDRLVGWPTNFELDEYLRRVETTQAVSLWKAKSSALALDLVMQNTIGWSVDIFEGMDQTFRLNTRQLQQPADWVEGETDYKSELPIEQQPTGVWSEIQTPYMATWAPSGSSIRSPNNQSLILPSNSGWQNLNGVLIQLNPSKNARTTLSLLALKKAKNLIPLFVPHYAQVFFSVVEYYREEIKIGFLDEFDDDFQTSYPTEPLTLDITDETGKYKSALCLFHTWDVQTELNSTQYRTFHSEITFMCE